MNYIVIDLEMNPISYQHKNLWPVCRNEVIEIGAVLLDEEYKEIDSFKTYVRPEYNAFVTSQVRKLTGITTEMVENAPAFKEAIKSFFKWCLSITGADSLQLVQWSPSDHNQIAKEVQLKGLPLTGQEQILMDSWCDLQEEYEKTIGAEKSVSLSNAVMLAGEDFEGSQHDALFDARNTARLLETLRNPDKCQKALGSVISVMKSEPLVSSLGDLFDFNIPGLQLG